MKQFLIPTLLSVSVLALDAHAGKGKKEDVNASGTDAPRIAQASPQPGDQTLTPHRQQSQTSTSEIDPLDPSHPLLNLNLLLVGHLSEFERMLAGYEDRSGRNYYDIFEQHLTQVVHHRRSYLCHPRFINQGSNTPSMLPSPLTALFFAMRNLLAEMIDESAPCPGEQSMALNGSLYSLGRDVDQGALQTRLEALRTRQAILNTTRIFATPREFVRDIYEIIADPVLAGDDDQLFLLDPIEILKTSHQYIAAILKDSGQKCPDTKPASQLKGFLTYRTLPNQPFIPEIGLAIPSDVRVGEGQPPAPIAEDGEWDRLLVTDGPEDEAHKQLCFDEAHSISQILNGNGLHDSWETHREGIREHRDHYVCQTAYYDVASGDRIAMPRICDTGIDLVALSQLIQSLEEQPNMKLCGEYKALNAKLHETIYHTAVNPFANASIADIARLFRTCRLYLTHLLESAQEAAAAAPGSTAQPVAEASPAPARVTASQSPARARSIPSPLPGGISLGHFWAQNPGVRDWAIRQSKKDSVYRFFPGDVSSEYRYANKILKSNPNIRCERTLPDDVSLELFWAQNPGAREWALNPPDRTPRFQKGNLQDELRWAKHFFKYNPNAKWDPDFNRR